MSEEQAGRPTTPRPSPPDADAAGPLSSVLVLLLGIVLAVGTAKAIELLGLGGELVSQAVGAASGAAPLLFDGLRRRRRAARRMPRVSLGSYRHGRPPLLVGGLFGFVVLIIDTAIGPYLGAMTRAMLRAATGSTDGYLDAFVRAVAFVQFPVVIVLVLVSAVAASHRISRHRHRWLWFGIGLYVLVRVIMVLTSAVEVPGSSKPLLIISAVVLGALLGGIAMIGAWIGGRTQAAFTAAMFFTKLSVADQQAALALLANNDDDPDNDVAGPVLSPRFTDPAPDRRAGADGGRPGEPSRPPTAPPGTPGWLAGPRDH